MNQTFDTLVRVRYAETDKMGVVYYGNYYIYFEVGRVEYMRNLGIDYRRMEIEDDSMIVVAESKCRYRRPAHYDDLLRVRTRVVVVKRRTIHFGYEILRDGTGELLAEGETIHVVCGSNGKPKALAEKYRRILENKTEKGSSA
ncbi:MAG: acyl-CoA thioesterase [Acidobacteriia bacterium]|nr:acyl-CoA thioesterase [Terriglobia bacterium]